TERKQAEAALHRAYDELEQKVQQRTAALTQANEALRAEVAARQHAQHTLESNEARFASIINSAMDAIISVDSHQHIVLFNHAAEQMFGYNSVEMTGQPLERLLPAAARAKHADHMQRFGETKTTSRTMGALGAISGVRKGGEEFPLEASISQVEANGLKLFTVILRDITRRKEAEERMREQAALLNLAREAIVVIDAAGHTLFWNTGAERLYGWPVEEAMGRDMSEQIYGTDQTQREAARRVLLEKGEWSGELRQFTKDGQEIIVESHWTQLRDAAGHHKAKLIINNDVTEKKQLEAQFLRAQRMESIGTLAGGIAHDLNNILSPISMGLQMMQMKYADEHAQKMLGMMTTNVNRGADMVKQILQFARGVSGERLALQPKHIVKDLLKMLGETFPKSIAVKQQLAEDTALVLGDATQLHQVLLNLSVNARDAMPHGGTLTLSLTNEEIKPSYSPIAAVVPDAKPGFYVVLTVADTGEGIAPDVLDRIFDPFFTTKELGKGTGLGLSTVFGIVRAHEGFITVESKVGQGTQFKVHLPACISPATVQPKPARHDTPVGQGELILVVDDEAPIREMNRAALEAYGYRVLTAPDGSAAIALYAQHQSEVQLLLTDMMMPVMDGVTLIRTLRQLNPVLRVICCSGTAGAMENPELEQLGVHRILAKPLNAETLLRAVGQVLSKT
ncbi:MAG: PAS domain S-box protein, partial [Acidobacteria bacterium]|nr:PAS domain S-box protein [Acidobacteriota bacterium]